MELKDLAEKERPPFWNTPRLIKLFIFAIGVLIAACTALFVFQQDTRDKIKELDKAQEEFQELLADEQEAGYRSRAIDCRIQLALDLPLKENCLAPEVVEFYDPQEVVVGNNFRRITVNVLCSMAYSQNISVPECADRE